MRQNFQQDIVDFSRLFKGTPGEKYGHDDVLHFNTQASSQWDGLRHVGLQIQGGLYYNGMKHEDIDSKKTLRNGIHSKSLQGLSPCCLWKHTSLVGGLCKFSNALADHATLRNAEWIENGGIVGRGILLDYVRWRQETGQPAADPTSTHSITVPELEQVAKHQGLEFKPGDILIVRSGYTLWHGNADEDEQAKVLGRGSFIGVEPSLRTLKWLWNHHFAAVAGDTIGFESAPIDWEEGGIALHNWLIDHWGSPIGELFNLEPLSALCAEHKRWSFFLTSHPLYSPGGVASPPNAIAIM